MNISGNTIFIPGATSGIGLGLALRLHAAGNTVIVGGRRTELLAEIVRDNPGIESVVVDTADAASILSARDSVVSRFPDTNVVIAMAGIMLPENLHTAEFLATAEAIVVTNLLGPIRLVAAFSEFLAQKPDATFMTVSSGLAFVPLPMTPTYSATKAAIHSFSVAMRVQLADTSVRVLELVPPAVQTTLMGQQELASAMPLEAYLSEVMQLIEAQPDAEEILVERVGFLRNAERRGDFQSVLGVLSGH